MTALLDIILGPIGAALGGILAALVAFVAGRSNGRQKAKNEALQGYQKERKKIDETDLGIGASDGERIDRLRDIAAGYRRGKD